MQSQKAGVAFIQRRQTRHPISKHVGYPRRPCRGWRDAEQCIVREMKEEMELDLEGFQLLSVMEFIDRAEYTFSKKANLDIEKIKLHEGQQLKWFTESKLKMLNSPMDSTKLLMIFSKKPRII